MKMVLAFTLGVDHPSARLRIAAYADYFRARGWRLQLHPFADGMGKTLPRSDCWWRRLTRRVERGWQTARSAAALNKIPPTQPIIISRELPVSRRPFLKAPNPLVLDVDDALYLGSGRGRFLELCQRAQVVVCGNHTIADALKPFARRCVVIPTVVETELYRVRTDYRLAGPLRLGWLGSSMSLNETLLPWLELLPEIRRQLKINFELLVIADEPPKISSAVGEMRFLKWSPEVEETISDHFDIGLMPLQNNSYQAAKCGAKLVQYMAAGLPVVAAPVGVNAELVIDGVTGFLAADAGGWIRALQLLAETEALRMSLGQAGRARAVENYSVARWGDEWLAVLSEISR